MLQPIIADPAVTRHILKKFRLRAVKSLGQNFLVSSEVVNQIVTTANIKAGDNILEIGPGIGTLTQGLLEAGANVTAIEIDKKLPAVLRTTLAGYENFHLVEGDVLKINLAKLLSPPFKVVANLPYYITTQILLTLLEKKLSVTKIVTMVQREVAERIIATPGSKIYGALSVAVQFHSAPRIAFNVLPENFLPSPEVTSSVIVCDVHQKFSSSIDEKFFTKVVRASFSQRRKTLLNSLIGAGFLKEKILDALNDAEIDSSRRAETLSVEDFIKLSEALK